MYKNYFNPLRDLRNLRNLKREFQHFADDFLGDEPVWEGNYWRPSVDMIENDDAYLIAFELPGMKKEDINIQVRENTLTISGDRKPFTEDKNYFRSEFLYGPFNRSVTIPGEINRNKVNAKYQNGILFITLPKKEEAKVKEIKIEVN
jgi:HSP20 family protein